MKLGVFTVMLPDLTPEAAVTELRAAGYDTATPAARRNEAPSFWGNNLCTLEPTTEDAARAAGLRLVSLTTCLQAGNPDATENALHVAMLAAAPHTRAGSVSPAAWASFWLTPTSAWSPPPTSADF